MKRILSLIGMLASLLSGIAYSHEDTPLVFEKGKITGLPAKYRPAFFDQEKKILTIAGKSLIFPDVIHRLFTDDRVDDLFGGSFSVKGHPYKLKFSASWYHEGVAPELPPYMLIKIEPEDRDYAFELLIDMDRSRFLRADAQIATVGAVPIDLDGVVDRLEGKKGGADEPATAPESKHQGSTSPTPDSEGARR